MIMRYSCIFLTLLFCLGVHTTAIAEKTLVYCSEGDPEGFDPALYSSGITFDASSRQIFNRLVEVERGGTEIRFALAKSCEISTDKKMYIFQLRKDVEFHPFCQKEKEEDTCQRTLNAEDVVFSFKRQYDQDHVYHDDYLKDVGRDYGQFHAKGMRDLIESVEGDRDDKLRVIFKLKKPSSLFLRHLSRHFASIHSKQYAVLLKEKRAIRELNTKPVGTGPFRFSEYTPHEFVKYERHDQYWNYKDPAKVEKLEFRIISDASERYKKLNDSSCHVMTTPSLQDLDKMKKEKGKIQIITKPGLNVGYLAFNTEKKPFDHAEVRRVLSVAISKETILKEVFKEEGQVAHYPVPPALYSSQPPLEQPSPSDRSLNEQLAKALEGDDFYRGMSGFDTEIWVTPTQRLYNPNATEMAKRIQADLSKIGVRARIVSYDWEEYLGRSKAGDHQMILLGWTADNLDPGSFMLEILGCDAAKLGENRTRWCHPKFDDHLRQGEIEQALEIFTKEAPMVAIVHANVIKPVRSEVKGFCISPFGGHVFSGVEFGSDSQTSSEAKCPVSPPPWPAAACSPLSTTPDRDDPKK